MTIPNVVGAATAVSSELAAGAVTSSILATPAVTATDAGQQIVATLVDPPTATLAGGTGAVASPETVERVRQQEKEKLHTQLTQRDERLAAMEAELGTLRAEREAKLAADAAAEAALEEAKRLKDIAESSAKDLVLKQQTEWETRFAELQTEREVERATLEKERQFSELRAYIQEQVRVNADDIAPQLFDLITGNTTDEVNASIATMKAKTAEILNSVLTAQTQQKSQMRGVSSTSVPGAGADVLGGTSRQLTAQQLKDMPLSDYAKYRSQLGVTGNSTNKNRGLFD